MLVAGLAMVQMDANTENKIQVLSETEMLITQGALSVNGCEEKAFVYPGDPNRWDICKTKDCQTFWNGFGWASYKQKGDIYTWCTGVKNPSKDCVTASNINEGLQSCGVRQEYWGPYCHSWFARQLLRDLKIAYVHDRPHDPNVPCSSS